MPHYERKLNSSPRNYREERKYGRRGGRLRRVGLAVVRAGITVGEEFAKGGPLPEERLGKLGIPRVYRIPYGAKGWTASSKKIESWIETGRFTRDQKKTIREMIKRRDPIKKWSPQQKGISLKQMQEEIFPDLVKEFGEKGADALMRRVGMGKGSKPGHSIFTGGRQRSVEDVLKHLRGARNEIGKFKYPLAEQLVKRAHPPFQPAHKRGLTQEEVYEIEEEVKEAFGEKVAAEYGRRLGAEDIASEKKQKSGVATTREARLGTFAQRHGVRSVTTTQEAAGEPSGGRQSTLSRLKSFISK